MLDLNLPGVRGLEVLARLKARSCAARGADRRVLRLHAPRGHRRRLCRRRQRLPDQADRFRRAAADGQSMHDFWRIASLRTHEHSPGDRAGRRRQPGEPLRPAPASRSARASRSGRRRPARTGSRAAAEDPDLILLDVHLPDIDGFEVCRRLKQDADTRHIPVLQRSQSHVDDAARVLRARERRRRVSGRAGRSRGARGHGARPAARAPGGGPAAPRGRARRDAQPRQRRARQRAHAGGGGRRGRRTGPHRGGRTRRDRASLR